MALTAALIFAGCAKDGTDTGNEKQYVSGQSETAGNQVRFGNRLIDTGQLSEETLEWLVWYNGLPEEDQLAINHVPADLLEECGLVNTEDAPASEN